MGNKVDGSDYCCICIPKYSTIGMLVGITFLALAIILKKQDSEIWMYSAAAGLIVLPPSFLYFVKACVKKTSKFGDRPFNGELKDLPKGATYSDIKEYTGLESPLIWAIRKKDDATVRTLLQRGASPQEKDEEGYSAFHQAVRFGLPIATLRMMKQQEARTRARSPEGTNALHMTEDPAVVRFLVDECSIPPDGGAIYSMVRFQNPSAAIRALNLNVQQINKTDSQGRTAFQILADLYQTCPNRHYLETAKTLFDFKANPAPIADTLLWADLQPLIIPANV